MAVNSELLDSEDDGSLVWDEVVGGDPAFVGQLSNVEFWKGDSPI